MRAFVGTSGYSYKEWKGDFYPEDLPASRMLRYYGTRFSSVEINNTFYRMPKPEVVAKWATEVPDDFVFVLKASRRITHEKRLKDASDAVDHFFEVGAKLGEKRGPSLFQLPPFMKKDVPRLREFLATSREAKNVAFEFRHPSWFDSEVYDSLRESGAALCQADMAEQDGVERSREPAPALVSTASWGYLRLRRCDYKDADLVSWITRIREQTWERVFVFFKHEDEGTGPRLAARFRELF